jgi:predicted MFS family arabinose efflux permease
MTAHPAGEKAAKKRDDAGILITLRESPPAVKALLLGVFVNKLGAFIQIFMVLFLTHRGFTAVQAGAGLSAYGIGAVVGVLAGGVMSDWLGPRRATLVSMVGTAVLVLGVLYVRAYPALLATVFLLGAISLLYRPASASLLSELTPKNRQVMIFAIYRLALNLGMTAAPLIGAALISISYSLLFWAEGLTALGYAVIAMYLLPRRGVQAEPDQPGPQPAGAEGGQAKVAARQDRGGFLAVLSDGRYLLFLFAVLINAVVYMQYVSTLPLAMRAAGLALGWYSAVIALNGVIVITCELLMTKVTQRLPAKLVVMFGFLLLGGGMAIYALPGGLAIFVIGTLVWSLAEIVAGPTVFAYPAIAGPDRLRGRYIGLGQATFALGGAIGPVAGLAVWNGEGRVVWVWCGVACLIGMAATWGGMRQRPREAEDSAGRAAPDVGTDAAGIEVPADAAEAEVSTDAAVATPGVAAEAEL